MTTLTRQDMYNKKGECILPVKRSRSEINRSKYCPCSICKGGIRTDKCKRGAL